MSIDTIKRIIETGKDKKEILEMLNKEPTRALPKPPPGGISIRAAARKYKLKNETLSKWSREGYIPIIKRTTNAVFLDEETVIFINERFKALNGGRRKWTIRQIIKELRNKQE